LGLPICRQIVAEHKGVIGRRPNPTKGAVFYFTVSRDLDRRSAPE